MSSPSAPIAPSEHATPVGEVRVPRGLFVALAETGVDVAADARAVGIDPARLDAAETALSRGELDGLLARVFAPGRGATAGLLMGERVRLELFGVVGLVALSAPDYGAALGRCARYKRLLSDLEVVLERGPRTSRARVRVLGARADADAAVTAARVEAELAFLATLGRRLTARPVTLEAARLARARPSAEDVAEFERVLGCAVTFGAACNEIVMATADLATPLLSANPEAHPLLAVTADRRLTEAPDELRARVRDALITLLPEGTPSVGDVAARLAVSERTMQRRLRAEGTSFAEVLDDARRALSQRYLADERFNVVEVSYLLGFSHPSSFHRAFRRWTGTTPSAYQRDALARPGRA